MAGTVSQLLEEWELPQLINIFEENEITEEAFGALTNDTIKELITKVGPRILFLKKYKQYKTAKSIQSDEDTISVVSSAETSDTDFKEDTDVTAYTSIPEVGLTQEEINNTPAGKQMRLYEKECADKVGLKKMLEGSVRGKEILNSYEACKKLSEHQQDVLVQLIIENEIKDNLDIRITSGRYEVIANAIVGVFPSEVKEVYFSQTFRKIQDKWRKVGGGKLFRRFYNSRRSLQISGLLTKRKHTSEESETVLTEMKDADNDDEIKWLMNSVEPWNEIVVRWENTFEKRLSFRENISIFEYIHKFPVLKSKLGYTLLESDFQKLFPSKDMQIFSHHFDSFAMKVVKYAKTLKKPKIVEYMNVFNKDLSKDGYNMYILMLLPLLIKPSVIKKKQGTCWKPSSLEISEGFICHVKVVSDIKTLISRRATKLEGLGLTLQPIPVVVGHDIEHITSSYVSINEVLYQLPTPLKAVDVCFKVIHTLNASYSAEAEQIWLLMQRGIYKITTTYDKILTATENILKELDLKRD